MTLATEKVKTVTERFMLVRLNPARYIEPVLNGSVYEITFTPKPNRIERNGVALTEVTVTPTVNDTWQYDDTTGLLKVKLAAAPDDETNVLVAYYYLYYTGDIYRAAYETPDDDTTELREWQPRLERYPAVQQSFSNILAGVFTISDVAVSIINEDGGFQSYLSDDDTFFNKDIDIWLCLGSTDNIEKVFSGTIQSLSLSGNSVRVRAVDRLKVLAQAAFFGDTADECYYRRSAASFPSLDPNAHDRPVPYIVGSSSRYKTKSAFFMTGLPDLRDIDDGLSAYCTNFSSEVTSTNNRTWGMCRMKSGAPGQTVTPTALLHISGGVYFVNAPVDLDATFIGDQVYMGGTKYAIVRHVGAFTYLANSYNLIMSSSDTSYTFPPASFTVLGVGLAIKFTDGTTIYPLYLRDWNSTASTTTSGGNEFYKITFTNNFEANFAEFGGGFLDPQIHQVIFRISQSSPQTHGVFLKDAIEAVGFTANAASFTAADAALAVNCRFHVPYFDELSYKTYLDYAQDVLASTLGYLKLNSAGEVEYKLLATPTSTDTRDTRLVLEGATRCEVDYQDITTQIIGYNPHNDSQAALDGADTPADTRENVKARYLHGFVNVNRFRHVLEELSSRIDAHIGLKSMRRAVYTFDTATEDVETELGDDLQLDNKIVLGGSESTDVKVQSITKAPGRISIEATDLRGL